MNMEKLPLEFRMPRRLFFLLSGLRQAIRAVACRDVLLRLGRLCGRQRGILLCGAGGRRAKKRIIRVRWNLHGNPVDKQTPVPLKESKLIPPPPLVAYQIMVDV